MLFTKDRPSGHSRSELRLRSLVAVSMPLISASVFLWLITIAQKTASSYPRGVYVVLGASLRCHRLEPSMINDGGRQGLSERGLQNDKSVTLVGFTYWLLIYQPHGQRI